MYNIFLALHSLLRWPVLILALIVVIKALIGWLGQQPYKKLDNILSASFTGFAHLQLLLGLILYFALSPKGVAAFQVEGVMKNAALRYFAVEHIFAMVIAVVLITIGRSKSKKAKVDMYKHRHAAIFFGLGLLFILARIPWAPLFRSF